MEQSDYGAVIAAGLAFLLAVSEILAFFPGVKENAVYQKILNTVRKLSGKDPVDYRAPESQEEA